MSNHNHARSTDQLAEEKLCPDDLIAIFNRLFTDAETTCLQRGLDEPIFLPAGASHKAITAKSVAQVVFAHGYFSSALHEIAHWCIAGKDRRQQVDYGYWYAPDGRNHGQQREFEQVEVKPQALEWILSSSCGKAFRISVDNLNGETTDAAPFKQAVYRQLISYCEEGLPRRAERLRVALCERYGVDKKLDASRFSLDALQ
ncbi:MAG: elongation factor P hydroxylase [Oceanicoccus sp.]|jgi:elongation factor P hydroxylase